MHADVLKDRHEQGPLATLMPFDEFLAADYFLFLRSVLLPNERFPFAAWQPWSTLFLKHPPRFILDARRAVVAQPIATALGVPDIAVLKGKLPQEVGKLKELWRSPFWEQPVTAADIERIGTS